MLYRSGLSGESSLLMSEIPCGTARMAGSVSAGGMRSNPACSSLRRPLVLAKERICSLEQQRSVEMIAADTPVSITRINVARAARRNSRFDPDRRNFFTQNQSKSSMPPVPAATIPGTKNPFTARIDRCPSRRGESLTWRLSAAAIAVLIGVIAYCRSLVDRGLERISGGADAGHPGG